MRCLKLGDIDIEYPFAAAAAAVLLATAVWDRQNTLRDARCFALRMPNCRKRFVRSEKCGGMS